MSIKTKKLISLLVNKMKWEKSPPNPFEPWAMHHLYVGIMCIVFGFLGLGQWWSWELGWFFITIGIIITIDDIIEHTYNSNTPLRILFEVILYPIVIVTKKTIIRSALDFKFD